MRKARYRIEQITIEGFRGVTSEQTIACEGMNLFVFGPNGQGKSSIIEAIRWCLFGSQAGKEIEIRNTFYETGNCVVSLVLSAGDDILQLRRELRAGVDRSRLSIRTSTDDEVTLQAALPELARIGHEQGTQVIFAAQQSVGRQATVDIGDFTEVLCFYLHLEDVPNLVRRLRRILEERTAEADKLAGRLESVEQQFRQLVNQLQTKLGVLLANPPWGDGPAPTGEETEARISALLDEQARLQGIKPPTLSGKAALEEMRKWINASEGKTAEVRQERFTTLTNQLQQSRAYLDELKAAAGRTSLIRAERDAAQARRTELLNGRTADSLRAEVEQIERSMSAQEIRVEIARLAEALNNDQSMSACPLCDTHVADHTLRAAITNHMNEAAGAAEEGKKKLAALQATLHEVDRVTKIIEAQTESLAGAEAAESEFRVALCGVLGTDVAADMQKLERCVETLAADVESLKREIDAAATERQRKTKAVKDLESELSFHDYRDQSEETEESLGPGLDPLRNILAGYHELLRTVSDVAGLVDGAFNDALDRIAPGLNSLLTEVYSRLTRQVSYDEIHIWRSADPPYRRELRVASSRLEGHTFAPSVLNGQAAKALRLVPYFVFSRFQPEIMELDLLLIDDPSESFDTSHVESLVAELAEAGRHAQLVIATHEREKFEPHLRTMFVKEPYKIATVEAFDPYRGPTIVTG